MKPRPSGAKTSAVGDSTCAIKTSTSSCAPSEVTTFAFVGVGNPPAGAVSPVTVTVNGALRELSMMLPASVT
jgi:hypothetical protein